MILVTGATGHVGRELIPQLLEAGQSVRVLVRDERKVAHLHRSVQRAVGDLNDPASLRAAVQGAKQIFLVSFETQQDVNMLEAARSAGICHIVKLSTLEAAQHAIRVGKWHYEREELIRASGLEWTFLRPGMFMSNSVDWWAASIKAQGAVFFPGGKGRTAPIDPADVASVAARALTEPGHAHQSYELTGPELMSVGDMVQVIGKVLGRPLKYQDIPPLAATLWMLKSGMDRTLVSALMEMLKVLRNNQAAMVTDSVRRITGRPAHTFEAWCRQHTAAFRPAPGSPV